MTTTRVAKPCCPAANDADVTATMKIAVKVRKALLKSMMSTFPVSSYLWAVGVTMVGLLYVFNPQWSPPADIRFFADTLWGVILTTAGVGMIYSMVKEKSKAINVLSVVIFLFAMSLCIASVLEGRPVSSIATFLTSVYYAYVYLCGHLIVEWRVITTQRKHNLQKDLDLFS